MRISTISLFDQSVSTMNRQQSDLMKVGQQIATGRRVVNPSDDPQAASQALGVSQSKAITEQFTDARVSARNSLAQQEGVLNSITDAITRAKTLMVQASSDTLSDTDRASVAVELRGIYETLVGQANATDGNGRYLFGGYQDSSPPFVRNVDGLVEYVGDEASRELRIDASRLIPVADNGIKVFNSVHSSAGYIAEADVDNQGSVIFTGPTVINSADPDYGENFVIDFEADADGFNYRINGGPAQPYVSGDPLSFGGLSLVLKGDPVVGDSIRLGRGMEMNTDLFASFEKAMTVLESPSQLPVDKAALRNTMSTVMRELDNSLDNVLTVRASVGARLNELDIVDSVAVNRILNYEQTLSGLVDLDYVEAIAEYSLRQVGLEAAQKTFVDMNKLSLFNFL